MLCMFAACNHTPSMDAQAILALHEAKFEWLAQKDTARLAALLSDDVRYIHSNGWEESKAEVLDNILNGILHYKAVQVIEADVRMHGNTGIVNGQATFDIVYRGEPIVLELKYTEVYIYSGDAVKLVSRHACKPILP